MMRYFIVPAFVGCAGLAGAAYYPTIRPAFAPAPLVVEALVSDAWQPGGEAPPWVRDESRYGGSMTGVNLTYPRIYAPPSRIVAPVVRIRKTAVVRRERRQAWRLERTRVRIERLVKRENALGRQYNRELARMKGKRTEAESLVNEVPN